MMMTAVFCSQMAFLGVEPVQGWTSYVTGMRAWTIPAGLSLLLLLIILFIKLRNLPSSLRARNKSTLDPTQLEELMVGTPPQIVDLRSPEVYLGEKGHIRGSVNIPFDEFQKRIDELDTSHPRPIVLVDDNDALSHQVMPILEARGHRWIYVLKGGFRAWRREKYPVYFSGREPKRK
jgi:3-mercaptopyruvate sulfurtransferase SseA